MALFQNQYLDVVQAGVEDTNNPGTQVATTFRFHSGMFDYKYNLPTEDVTQAGNLYTVDESPGKGDTAITVKGKASVPDITHLLSMYLGIPSFAGVSGSVHSATFAPLSLAETLRNTYTFEKGQSGAGNANVVTNVFGQDFELDFTPTKTVEMSGKLMGRSRITDQTLTGGVTQLPSGVLSAIRVSTYIATSEAGLSGALLVRPFAPFTVKWKHNKTQSPVTSLDPTTNSFDGSTSDMPDCEFDLVLPRSSATEAYIDSIANGSLYFIQILAQGPLIESGLYHQVTITAPVRFKTPDEGNNQNVMTNTVTARVQHTDTFNTTGGAVKVVCQSTLASLA